MIGAPARAQPRSLTVAERRARATRPDLWPSFLVAVFPERPPAPAPVDDGWDELVDDLIDFHDDEGR